MANPSFKDFAQVANAQGIYLQPSVVRLAMDADPQPSLPQMAVFHQSYQRSSTQPSLKRCSHLTALQQFWGAKRGVVHGGKMAS